MNNKRSMIVAGIILCLLSISLPSQTNIPPTPPCTYNLTLSGSPYIATTDIVVGEGCTMNVNAGVEIVMAENTHLIIKGKADFVGTAAQPIHIHATDSVWGNILLDSTLNQKSTFSYVIFENARESVKSHQEPGAIYGYYSSVEIRNCHFKNNLRCVSNYQCPGFVIKDCLLDSTNRGEKIHGQYCDGALVENCTLYATNGDNDAIDFDASNNVTIRGNLLYHGGDDGIDIGQCDSVGCNGVLVQNNRIFDMFNKGVSNGENCLNITIDHNIIGGCAMGIGAKSGAHVWADHNTLYNNRLGVNSYQHLDQVWGPGHLTVTNSIIAGGDTIYHVDATAYLSIAYSLSPDTLMPGTGNLMGDPAFVAPGLTLAPDFHLQANSAAIDKGDPGYAPDPDGSRSDIGALYFGSSNSISEIRIEPIFSIYPNPSEGLLHLQFTRQSRSQIRVMNVTGQVIFSETFTPDLMHPNVAIDLAKQPRGIYYLEVHSDHGRAIGKFVLD